VDHLVTGYISLSVWHKKKLIETYGLDESKIHIIGNGLHVPAKSLVSNKKKIAGKFIWVSQYDRGLAELISQFPKIIKEMPHAHLDIYRNLPEDFQEAVKYMSYVNVKGQATNEKILDAFAEAEYWYYPTKWNETYCISALEALANGCLCIATDLAALSTTIGDRGVLLKESIYSEEYWNSGIKAIMRYENDPDLKRKTIEKGKKWAREQEWCNIASYWLDLLESNKDVNLKDNNMFNRLRDLKRIGFDPKYILDIGANIGNWNLTMKKLYPDADIVSFEANEECREHLESRKLNHIIGLLGDEDIEDVEFYTIGNSECTTGASIYREKTSYYDDHRIKVSKLPMRRLDDYVKNNKRIDLMKLDVQGSEIRILEGALYALKRTDFVLLEISIMKYNEGSPLFAEVIDYMNSRGFKVFDILENHYINKFCMQTDVLFLNKNSLWTRRVAEINTKDTHWKVNNIYE
jgi:FkbM family methyltransferase